MYLHIFSRTLKWLTNYLLSLHLQLRVKNEYSSYKVSYLCSAVLSPLYLKRFMVSFFSWTFQWDLLGQWPQSRIRILKFFPRLSFFLQLKPQYSIQWHNELSWTIRILQFVWSDTLLNYIVRFIYKYCPFRSKIIVIQWKVNLRIHYHSVQTIINWTMFLKETFISML